MRYVKDHSIDGWPVVDTVTNRVLSTNEIVSRLNAHDPAQQWIKCSELTTVDALQHIRDRGLVEQPVMSGLYKLVINPDWKPSPPEVE